MIPRFLLRIFALVSVLACVDSAAHAATYYVATTGSNAGTGLTPATAFTTLQFCANRAVAGDVFLVADGDYAGFNVTRSGASGTPITFRTQGNNVRITTVNTFTNQDGINLEGANWVVIEGFICSNLPRAGIRAVLGDHNVIRGNVCENNGRWGIFTGFTNDLTVEHNVCAYSLAEHGIYVSNSSDRAILRHNRCHHNRGGGIQINADLSQGGDGLSTDCEISSNVIWENGVGGGAGINLDGVIGARICNNLLYENHATGIALFQIDGATSSRNAVISHNTIVQAANGRWCILLVDGATGATLRNNILVTQHAFRGSIVADTASLSGLDSDYNLVTDRLSADGDSTILSLSAWRTATGQDTHSLAAPALDAIFANRGAADFRLSPTSPARDAGVTLADNNVARDPQGIARPQGAAFDLGAFERVTTAAPAATARFINLSTRARATTADPVIAGFVIVGSGNRDLLLRVVGPGLVANGVPTALADPELRLYAGATLTAQNDNWDQASNLAALQAATTTSGAFPLTTGSDDAALFTSLAPGSYTIHGAAKSGSAGGVVLVEVYDVGGAPGATSRLANVSTRAIAGTGDDTIIAGFVLAGADTSVLTRAAGPALVDFGVANFQRDPQLALFDGSTPVASNDQWSLAANSAATAALAVQLGAFPLRAGSNDAALNTTLAPRLYTAHATPAPDASPGGSLLIEVYAP